MSSAKRRLFCLGLNELRSCDMLQSMKFCGIVVWVRWQQIEKSIWYFAGLSQMFIVLREVQSLGVDILGVQKAIKASKRYKVWI